jgi:hypothetical protein
VELQALRVTPVHLGQAGRLGHPVALALQGRQGTLVHLVHPARLATQAAVGPPALLEIAEHPVLQGQRALEEQVGLLVIQGAAVLQVHLGTAEHQEHQGQLGPEELLAQVGIREAPELLVAVAHPDQVARLAVPVTQVLLAPQVQVEILGRQALRVVLAILALPEQAVHLETPAAAAQAERQVPLGHQGLLEQAEQQEPLEPAEIQAHPELPVQAQAVLQVKPEHQEPLGRMGYQP